MSIGYYIFRYSHFDSNTFRYKKRRYIQLSSINFIDTQIIFEREKRGYNMISSGILITIRIPSDIRKGDTFNYLQWFSLILESSSIKEKQTHYEKPKCVWCLQIFSLTFELPCEKGNQAVYDVFRYSCWHLNYLPIRETKTRMTSLGILIDIRITLQ